MTDVALVCGGGGALGSAVVRAFLARGDRVVAADRHGGGALPEGAAVRGEVVDLTAPEEIEALWERLAAVGERPRWVVNAAGGFGAGKVADTDPDAYARLHDLNLGTAWWSCRAAARRLEEDGAIVNVGARLALTGGAGAAAYAVAKAGVVRLTEVLAAELAARRVRVNAVLPAVIDTPANRAFLPTERIQVAVSPEDLAAVVAFLASDAARAVTGAVIPVYGWA